MLIWSSEIKELEKLYESFKGQMPDLEKELEHLIKTDDPVVVLLYSRRSLELIVNELCEKELNRPRKTEPLKGIIDKLNSENKVPEHIVTSMLNLNSLSTYGAHPKDFDTEQVKLVLVNLAIILRWYLKYKDINQNGSNQKTREEIPANQNINERKKLNKRKILVISAISFSVVILLSLTWIVLSGNLKKASGNEITEKSIAVLPFKNLSNDPSQDYFSQGMTEEILGHLYKIGGLLIPSGLSCMHYIDQKLPVSQIARELNVSYILEGITRKYGDSIKITVSLVEGKTERILWRQDYLRFSSATNAFEIQADVASKVALILKVKISPEVQKRIDELPTENTEAYDLFLKANNFEITSVETKSYLEKAIDLDPGFAEAYAKLAQYYLYNGGHGGKLTREEVIQYANPLIEKALTLNPNSYNGHLANSIYKLFYFCDFKAVENEYYIIRQLFPSKEIHNSFTDFLLATGRFDEAYEIQKEKIGIGIKSECYYYNLVQMAFVYYFTGQESKALETMETSRRVIVDEPDIVHSLRIFTYTEKYEDEIRYFENLKSKNSGIQLVPYSMGHLGIAYYKTGNKVKATEFLNALINEGHQSVTGSPSFFTAAVYTAMGNKDKAFEYLEKAYKDHEVEMYWLKVEPLFKDLHGEARFEALLEKIGFN